MSLTFMEKLSVVLFLLAVACGVAGWASWELWRHMFDVAGFNQDFAALNVEEQSMKTPLNLVMYTMPVGFYCAGLGLLGASALSFVLHLTGCLIDSLCALWRAIRPVRGQSQE